MTFNEVREEFERQEDIEYGTGGLAKIDYNYLEGMIFDVLMGEYRLSEEEADNLWNVATEIRYNFVDQIDFMEEKCRKHDI
jgi:hypothetical protein